MRMNLNITDTDTQIEDRSKLSEKYDTIHNWFFLLETFLTIIGLAILIVGGNSGISGELSSFLNGIFPNIWCKNGAYVVILITVYTLFFIPLSFYKGFILEHRFGLSTQSIGNWIKDKLKSFSISVIILLIVTEIAYLLLRRTGLYWWVWTGFFWFFFTILMQILMPVFIIPLFFKLSPLDNSELSGRLKAMAQKAGVKVLGVFRIEFSKKTKKANAAITGIGRTKRILLADTLLDTYEQDEVEAIFAHELGHYHYRHIWQLIGVSAISTFLGLGIASKIFTAAVYKMGFSSIQDIGGFPILLFILFVFTLLVLPVDNAFSRMLERQADKFSIEFTGSPKAFIGSMTKLAGQNLVRINPNPVIHFLLHNHPSISQRIKMARRYL